jgi:NAD(P)-dependent dehydrogenase (short-subunit alcohol dehydrogenase family)/putative sterol carrier protein
MDICVNPECNAVNTQEDYEFADEPAFIKSFTGDLLAVSVDPPAIYGMIQFENGGRFMADFTDCELGDVSVGQKVSLAYRRRYVDKERGFSGYFWKAIPIPGTAPEVGEQKEGMRFDGKVAVVTGAGAGLGRSYALELAKRGAKVVVNDLGGARDGSGDGSKGPADEVVDEIKALGGEAVANYDSVATAEGGQSIVDSAIKAFGKLDIVINNAGILRDKTVVNMEPKDWDAVMEVHLKGAYNVSRPAFVKMRENRYGRIILTTSAAGLYGNFGQTNYSAAKMGLIGFMNTMKLEGDKHNIKINTIAPIAATRLTTDILPPDLLEKLKPEFVAPLVLYLCSEQCPVSGAIYNAGMGYFNRVAIATGSGSVVVGDGKEFPTPEGVAANFGKIKSMEGAEEYPNATAAFSLMLDAFSPKKKGVSAEADSGLTVKGIFEGLPKAFKADKAAGVDVVFQFDITGTNGGSWYATVKDGTCEVTEGSHSSPTTTIEMGDDNFVKMISGELNAMSAYTSGKLKIRGDLMKSQLIEKLFKF